MKPKHNFQISMGCIKPLAIVISCVFSSLVLATTPTLSGPSHAVAGDIVQLKGHHLPLNSSLRIEVQSGNSSHSELIEVSADGSSNFQLYTSVEGTYRVLLFDEQQQLITSTLVLVRPTGD
ncbi:MULTISPECIES: hypothetical protein [Alkalimonas]|uniref:Uncharacterized protein n=1 Tax=Alkalimonas mucilaginosa TaxID=3057676 RepID=A0ABU7JJA0_9GAMM|nr:hypothetical protein [Alkalimonas sp. MEB004]MEE2025755.1 hypothetical protein [Alkalimonas sp. MEB004]